MADQPEGQRCETCRYWKEAPDEATNAYGGYCRRYPPSIPDNGDGGDFPDIGAAAWCGEWAPANPETVEEGAAIMARLVLLGDLTAARALADKLKEAE